MKDAKPLSSSSSCSSFEILANLPAELLEIVLSWLTLKDLAVLSAVSHHYRLLTSDRWRRICLERSVPKIQMSLVDLHIRLPWKESFARSQQWRAGALTKQTLAKWARSSMPKVWLDSASDVVYFSDQETLRWIELEGQGVGRQGSLFTHNSLIVDFNVSVEEGWVLASLKNGEVLHWDLNASETIQNFVVGDAAQLDVAPASQGRFWSGNDRGLLQCWDLNEQGSDGLVTEPLSTVRLGEKVWSLKTHGGIVAAGVFGKDPLRIHDARTLQRLGTTPAHRHSVYGVHITQEGLVSTSSFDGTVALWDLRASLTKPVVFLDDPWNEPIYCVQFDGSWKVVCGTARWSAFRIWDIRSLQGNSVYAETKGESSPVYSLHFDDHRICVGLAQQIVMLSI